MKPETDADNGWILQNLSFLLGAVLDALNKQNGSGSQVFMWDIHCCKQDNNRKTIYPDLEMIIPSLYYFSGCVCWLFEIVLSYMILNLYSRGRLHNVIIRASLVWSGGFP